MRVCVYCLNCTSTLCPHCKEPYCIGHETDICPMCVRVAEFKARYRQYYWSYVDAPACVVPVQRQFLGNPMMNTEPMSTVKLEETA